MGIVKKIVFWGCITFFFGLSSFIAHNNLGQKDVSNEVLRQSFNQSVVWIKQHEHQFENVHNPMLWWMLKEVADLSKNDDLETVFNRYKDRNYTRYNRSAWSYLFFGTTPDVFNQAGIFQLPDYNLHFIYGFSCNKELAELDVIKQQNETNFCRNNYPLSPACVTHQLMAFRFMQRTGCQQVDNLTEKVEILSETIQYQSIFDFRVLDAYIQRVLMQLDSGQFDKVNKRWVQRIINAQQEDGGWTDFQPLIPLGNKKAIGFSTQGLLSVMTPVSNFHATVQGAWVMALLLKKGE